MGKDDDEIAKLSKHWRTVLSSYGP